MRLVLEGGVEVGIGGGKTLTPYAKVRNEDNALHALITTPVMKGVLIISDRHSNRLEAGEYDVVR